MIKDWMIFPGMNFAAGATVDPGAGGAAPAGGADATAGGAPPLVPADAGGAPGGGPPAAGATTPEPPESANIKQMRERIAEQNQQLAAWKDVGDVKTVQGRLGVLRNMEGRALELGEELGFTKDEVLDEFGKDPFRLLSALEKEAAKAEGTRPPMDEKRMRELLNKELENRFRPFEEKENLRVTDEAHNVFLKEVDRLTAEAYPGAQLEEAENDLLYTATSYLMTQEQDQITGDRAAGKADEKTLSMLEQLKFGGKVAGVQKFFQQAQSFLDAYYLARSKRETAAPGSGTPPRKPGAAPTKPGGAPYTLEEFIDGSSLDEKGHVITR